MSHNSNSSPVVPYFVLHLPDGRSKALFTVPSDLAEALVMYPIMARGACFQLQVDVVSQGRQLQKRRTTTNHRNGEMDGTKSNATSFLSTEFDSPRPEETAHAISERIRIRMESPTAGGGSTSAISGLFGLR